MAREKERWEKETPGEGRTEGERRGETDGGGEEQKRERGREGGNEGHPHQLDPNLRAHWSEVMPTTGLKQARS